MKSKLYFLVALLFTVSGTYAQKAEMPAPTSFQVGDKWEWRRVDNRTKLEEVRQTRTVVKLDGVLLFSNGDTNSQMANAFIGEPSPKPWRIWPLEVGKKWTFDGTWTRPDGVTGMTKQDAEVIAHEEVVTPAGKFMTFKIEYRGIFRNSRGGSGKQNDTYWYAPDVGADVKHVRDDGYNMYTRELVTHRRGTP